MKNIVLMGFMGAGKTTVGRKLARTLSWEFIDTDEWIEKEQGKKISDIFAESGEKAFRDLETELLEQLLERKSKFVLSIGGGMPVRKENRILLQRIGTVVYLKTSKEEILKRVSNGKNRPLLEGGALEEKVTALMDARESIYKETAQAEIITDGKYPGSLVKELLNL